MPMHISKHLSVHMHTSVQDKGPVSKSPSGAQHGCMHTHTSIGARMRTCVCASARVPIQARAGLHCTCLGTVGETKELLAAVPGESCTHQAPYSYWEAGRGWLAAAAGGCVHACDVSSPGSQGEILHPTSCFDDPEGPATRISARTAA